MIIDRLQNPSVITALPSRLKQAVQYLQTTNLAVLPVGRHNLDGDRLFVLVQEYTTRSPGECKWEAHRMYIDVQYLVRGTERMGFSNIAQATEQEPYDAARDVAFFQPGEDYVTVREGMLAIFGPEDVHAPCGAVGHPSAVRKIIIKVATD